MAGTTPLSEDNAKMQLNDSDTSDTDSEGWNEMETDLESSLTCLFCPQTFKTMAVALEHCKSDHSFDIMALKRRFSMDCYSYICLINYIRKSKLSPDAILSCNSPTWHTEEYFAPVIRDDPWLIFDFEGLDTPVQVWDLSPDLESVVKTDDGMVKMNDSSYMALLNRLHFLTNKVKEKEIELLISSEQIQKMKEVTQKFISGESDPAVQAAESRVLKLKISADHEYFNSYSHFGIHLDMLSDRTRTESYRLAIAKNPDVIKDKVILDIGCGSGILSMFCAQNEASEVYAVDQSDIIYQAMEIIRENNLEDKVVFIKGRVEEVELPNSPVDLIISEWMGYFLFYEGMLDSILIARDKFLRPGGVIMPNRCTLSLAAVSDLVGHKNVVGFWDDVYGFKMSCMKREALREAFISVVLPENIVSDSVVVHNLDIKTCTLEGVNFESDFELKINKDCSITALCGYFDTFFDLSNPVSFSTGPNGPATHWRQTIFYLPTPIEAKDASVFQGKIICRRNPTDCRALIVNIIFNNQSFSYELS